MGDDSSGGVAGFGRRAWSVVTPCLAGLAATLLIFWLLRDRLPARMPTHFGPSGADGFGTPGSALAGDLVVFVIQAVLFLVWTLGGDDPRVGARWAAPVAWASSVATAYLLCGTLFAAADAPDGRLVAVSPADLAVAAVLGLLTAGAGVLWRRRRQ